MVALALALRRTTPESPSVEWDAVFEFAIRERLGALIWLRAGDIIRSFAPRDVVDRWRTLAVVIDQSGRQRLAALELAGTALERAGIQTVVLKGMPLAQRLYGDPFVRASDDIDLCVAAIDRAATRRVLQEHGWTHVDGTAPWDELFALDGASGTYLEVHETLLTDYLAHLRLPSPRAERVALGDLSVRAAAGDGEAAYLAAHLAGHQLPPLLWVVDFLTLWEGLGKPERSRARDVAGRAGLGRYLDWAIELAYAVRAAASGDEAALARLGVKGRNRRDTHLSVLRHARLAAHPIDAARAVGACLWPRPIRWSLVALATSIAWRLSYRGHRRDISARTQTREVNRAVRGGRASANGTSP